jgi:predicted anti-sigma-YlaC factor YlaD
VSGDRFPHPELPPDGDASAHEVTCREFVELVTDYLEGTLAPSALDLVEEHLVMCDWCGTYLQQMETTIERLRSLRDEAPAQPPDRLLAAVRARAEGSQ